MGAGVYVPPKSANILLHKEKEEEEKSKELANTVCHVEVKTRKLCIPIHLLSEYFCSAVTMPQHKMYVCYML